MFIKKIGGIVVALSLLLALATAQDQSQDQSGKVIKHVPVKVTSAASGKEMYESYCAVCHGTDGKGNGPAASALKTPSTDLTTLSKNNGGKYPSLKVLRQSVAIPTLLRMARRICQSGVRCSGI